MGIRLKNYTTVGYVALVGSFAGMVIYGLDEDFKQRDFMKRQHQEARQAAYRVVDVNGDYILDSNEELHLLRRIGKAEDRVIPERNLELELKWVKLDTLREIADSE